MGEAPREGGATRIHMHHALGKTLGRGFPTLALQAASGQGVNRDCPLRRVLGKGVVMVPDHTAWRTTIGRGFAKLMVRTC